MRQILKFHWDQLFDRAKAVDPRLEVPFNRIYSIPAGYPPYNHIKQMAAVTALGLAAASRKRDASGLGPNINGAGFFERAADYHLPFYLVSRPISEALMNSEPPQYVPDNALSEIGFPAVLFMLPEKVFPVKENSWFTMLGIRWGVPGDPGKLKIQTEGLIGFGETNQRVTFDFFVPSKNGMVDISRMADYYHHRISDETAEALGQFTGQVPDVTTEDEEKNILTRLVGLCAQIAIVMSSRSDLVGFGNEGGGPAGDGKLKTTKKGREVWSPRYLGANYRTKTEHERHNHSASSHPARHTPETHWRRGHTRQQRYGKKLSKVKSVWIEPVLVNP